MQQRMRVGLALTAALASAIGMVANVAVAQGPKGNPRAAAAALGNGFTYQGQLKITERSSRVPATLSFGCGKRRAAARTI